MSVSESSLSSTAPAISMSAVRMTTLFAPNSSSLPNSSCTIENGHLHLPFAVFYSIFFIFGLVGNLFALWVFLFLHKRRNSVRVFLINCAVADLILAACLPFRVFYHTNRGSWPLGSVACKLVGTLFYINMYASITLLGFISLDRYVKLRGGRSKRGSMLKLKGRAELWSWAICGTLWSLCLALLSVFVLQNKDKGEKCFHYKRLTDSKVIGYINAVIVFFFWVVFITLVISYGRIASRLLRVSRDKPDLPNAHKYARTAKKSFFVLFLFTVCFVPYHVFRPVYIYSQLMERVECSYQEWVDSTNEVVLLLSTFNSCLDPVMYFLLSGSVRKMAVQALGRSLGHSLGHINDSMVNSSTMDFRRPSAVPSLSAWAISGPNTPSLTPRNTICVMNSSLRRKETTTLPSAGL